MNQSASGRAHEEHPVGLDSLHRLKRVVRVIWRRGKAGGTVFEVAYHPFFEGFSDDK